MPDGVGIVPAAVRIDDQLCVLWGLRQCADVRAPGFRGDDHGTRNLLVHSVLRCPRRGRVQHQGHRVGVYPACGQVAGWTHVIVGVVNDCAPVISAVYVTVGLFVWLCVF